MSKLDMPDTYLGDGVYASCDGYHIILDLREQSVLTDSRIFLEPEVMENLFLYNQRFQEERARLAKDHS